MKSITIYGLDDMLDKRIREKAKSQRLSLNPTIKKLLEESLGIKKEKKKNRGEDFREFFKVWSDNDLKEFNKNTGDFNEVDPGDTGLYVSYVSIYYKLKKILYISQG